MSSISSKMLFKSKAIENVEYLLYNEKYRLGALSVLKQYIRDSPLHVGAAVAESPVSVKELETVVSEVLNDNHVSVIAKEITTNRVIGVGITTIAHKPTSREETTKYDKIYEKYLKSDNSRKLLNVWKYIHSKIDFFNEYNVNCILNLRYLSVIPEYRDKKIASSLSSCIIELMNEWYGNPAEAHFMPEHLRNTPPELAVYLVTSRYSQKIDENNTSAERVLIFPNKDFIFNGKSFADRIGDQNSISVLGAIRPTIIKKSKI